MHNRVNEKSKHFVKDITRLFKELNYFKFIIIIALLIATVSTILSIISPNKLSKLTDEIQLGIIVDKNKIEEVNNNILNNIKNINIKNLMISNVNDIDKQNFIYSLNTINKDDYSSLLNVLNNTNNEIIDIILPSIKIEDSIISSRDQLSYLNVFSSIDENTTVEEIYKKVDELPSNISNLIKPKLNFDNIKSISILLASLYIISALLTYVESLVMTIVSNRFAQRLRNKISYKINKLPLKYFDNNQVGDILSRVTNDVDTIAQSMNQSLSTIVTSITLFVGTIIMMFITNWVMAVTAILSSLVGFVFMAAILSKSQSYFNARQKELGKLNSHIEEVYSNLLVVKAYNAQKELDNEFDKLNNKVYDANRMSQFLSGLMPPLMGFIGNLGYVCVAIVGAVLTSKEIITFGVIIAFITYVRLFSNSLSQMAQSLTSMQSTAAASSRVFEFLDEEEMIDESSIKTKIDVKDVKGNIDFENVKFGYDEKLIIKDFTASVRNGQKIAIVGPTGAGKTTMVNLLMKFYDIRDGDIKIDGISIKDIKREDIHKLFTMVLQDTWLFNASIKENIKYNRSHVTDKRVEEVCERVGLSHFINTLENTYDYVLDDNSSISSGQKQLLTIARGMIEDAPFLILDEATSNVDTRTEELVSKAMDKLMKGKTSFIIAHRLSTIKNADLILVMKDGNIIEQGNHEELLNKNGFYADLYNSQFQN